MTLSNWCPKIESPISSSYGQKQLRQQQQQDTHPQTHTHTHTHTVNLTIMEPCIARCVFYITNGMQLIQFSLLLSALYMFRAVFPLIIRSL